ncbi:MAG: sigW 7, partial [Acidobacteria bacterium]|nr:sigW 7 [Acidobacteriota bacterium]
MPGATAGIPTVMNPAMSTAQHRSADDVRVARACAAGDSDAFEEIYRRHGDRMKSIAYNHLGNMSDAEDAVQETFLKIHRAAASYNA